jgi:3-oxoacyl-[acyl-carrier protein] reductase
MASMVDTSARFGGRTVIVTGGAGGIGRAVAAGFAAEGAAVAVADTNADAIADTVEQLRETGGAGAEGFVVDVRDAAAVRRLMSDVNAGFGGPHLLVTLAGGSLGTPRDLASVTPDDIDLVLGVNVRGTLLCCQGALPYMVDAGGGAIVTVSSIGGRQPSLVTGVPYATAKAAVLGLTRRLAQEVGRHAVRVNAIAPGLVLTDRLAGMVAAMDPAERQSVLDAIPLRRLPELGEIVEPILFLASDAASYITGVVLDVNGGRFMPP